MHVPLLPGQLPRPMPVLLASLPLLGRRGGRAAAPRRHAEERGKPGGRERRARRVVRRPLHIAQQRACCDEHKHALCELQHAMADDMHPPTATSSRPPPFGSCGSPCRSHAEAAGSCAEAAGGAGAASDDAQRWPLHSSSTLARPAALVAASSTHDNASGDAKPPPPPLQLPPPAPLPFVCTIVWTGLQPSALPCSGIAPPAGASRACAAPPAARSTRFVAALRNVRQLFTVNISIALSVQNVGSCHDASAVPHSVTSSAHSAGGGVTCSSSR
eukprot:363353-Chlamydomonas_euryale.AAC.24